MTRWSRWGHLFLWGVLPSGAFTWTFTSKWYLAVFVVVYTGTIPALWLVWERFLERFVKRPA